MGISISCDALFTACLDCTSTKAGYLSKLQENVDALRAAARRITAQKQDVERRVRIAEERQLRRLDQVQGWISTVEDTTAKVEELLREDHQEIGKLCLGGYCSKNYMSSYKFAKKVNKMLQEVEKLRTDGVFDEVAERVPAPSVVRRSRVATVGLESTFNKVWTCLGEERVGIIGLYGMGGVGKTTLMTQINNEFLNSRGDYDTVIWVDVSKDLKLGAVQEKIGERMGFADDLWKNKSFVDKSADIFGSLHKKKFVLLFDDLWERVELVKLGVPLPNVDVDNGSKVVFTTRSTEVCVSMDAHKTIEVECLAKDDAWDLFQEKVGQETLCVHPDIPGLARSVANECDGLPLALIVVGRAMACKKTPQEWRHAIEILKKYAAEFSGMGKEVFPRLKFSYDNLPGHEARTCFLYCSLFPEDSLINRTELIDYWIGEGILDGYDNRAHTIIGNLLSACLLEDKDDCVRMHDVIRDMALWIASEIEKDEVFFVQTVAQLTEAPEIGRWKGVKRMSLIGNHIANLSETPDCSTLQTLFLGSNHLNKISAGFFQLMPSLTVLDLSNNSSILGLPSDVSSLVSLQYLNLSRTGIKELPIELKALVKLRYLNLDYTQSLYLLPHGLISSFQMIRVLRMFRCGSSEQGAEDSILTSDESLVEELQCLKKLIILTVTIRSAAALEGLSSFQNLQNCTQVIYLERFHDSKSKLLNFSSLANMEHLETLHICQCVSLEELEINWAREPRQISNNCSPVAIPERPFHSLSNVYVENCKNVRNLTWLILAQNLKFLRVSNCPKLLEVASEVPELVRDINPFARLEAVELLTLPHLKSFYCNYALPSLKDRRVVGCPLLDMRPLNVCGA